MPKLDPKMPLENAKWEHFAQLLSGGMALLQAYEAAGYSPDRKNAKRLAEKVADRVEALQLPVLDRHEITRDRWAREVAALAFSDVREAVQWSTETVQDVDNDDGGETLIIRHIHSHKAVFRDSKELKPEVAAAIQSVKVSAEGDIEIKMHPKIAALKLLGESLRLLGRHQRADDDGDTPAAERSPAEVADELTKLFTSALDEHKERAAHARLIEGTATEEPR